MLRHGLAPAILLSCALCLSAGCQPFHAPTKEWTSALASAREDRLVTELQSGGWHVDRNWSPLTASEPESNGKSSVRSYRWTSPYQTRVAKFVQLESTSPRIPESEADEEPNTSDKSITATLRRFAKRPGVVGWNAIVLLAQHDPDAAEEYVGQLEWLVVQRESPLDAATSSVRKWLPKAWASSGEKEKAPRPVPTISLRAAAAEMWCEVLSRNGEDLEQLLAPAGSALLEADLPAEVRRELWRSISRHLPPERIPLLGEALAVNELGDRATAKSPAHEKRLVPARSEKIDDRRAAAEACLIYAILHTESQRERESRDIAESAAGVPLDKRIDEPEAPAIWPEQFWDLPRDRDPQVRRSFGLALVAARHDQALPVLAKQLQDQDVHVRETAAFGLGWLGTPAASAELQKRVNKEDEHLRQWAVRGLGRNVMRQSAADAGKHKGSLATRFTQYVRDPSPIVRQEVARQLAKDHTAEAARELKELLLDKHLDVQGAVVTSVQDWPDDLAVPLLLESLSQNALRTRQAALAQLQKRKGYQLHFPISGDATARAAEAQRLAKLWSIPDPLVRNIQELAVRTSPRAISQRRAEIRDRLAALPASGTWNDDPALVSWFQNLAADDLPILEDLVQSVPPEQARFLRELVLPRLDAAYEALRLLADADVNLRRRGARSISQLGGQRSLSQSVMQRLILVLQGEQDRLVWRFVMQGVAPDASDNAATIAQLAVNSSWPDVRILGCEYVGRHSRPYHAAWLIPLFSDENKSVQIAAVTAAGRCRNPLALEGGRLGNNPAPVQGLRQLLHTAQGELRYRAVVSMACLGDNEAAQELVRMSFDPSPLIRQEVVQSMGQTGQTRFIEPLIRLAWTEPHPSVRQAAVGSLERLVPVDEQPARVRSREPRNLQQTIEFWAAWWEDHRPSETAGERALQRPLSRR